MRSRVLLWTGLAAALLSSACRDFNAAYRDCLDGGRCVAAGGGTA